MQSAVLTRLRGGGLTSVCSAHPTVIEAALRQALADGTTALIEATCNQVNQDGGYTGLDPVGLRDLVWTLAERVGLDRARIILGGDHLGPNPWRSLPAEAALQRAEAMIAAYVAAGFEKIHLDTSMGCAGEAAGLPDELTAARAARLAVVAERAASRAGTTPHYVVGTEVPVPGGATEVLDHLAITRPEAARATYQVHREAFAAAGLDAAFARVIALVVQPGVEFGHTEVAVYQPAAAAGLSAVLADLPVVFEAHSTDYQPEAALAALVRDGFAILKVGPALTFALREALYGLDAIAAALDPARDTSLAAVMEQAMLANPSHWAAHYHGTPAQVRSLRHDSRSDRIRYYWPAAAARAAVARLLARLSGMTIPPDLAARFLPHLAGRGIALQPETLVMESVRDVLRIYARACAG